MFFRVAVLCAVLVSPAFAGSLEDAYQTLHRAKFVDLTHAFAPGIPHWKGFKDEQIETLYTYDKAGFLAQEFSHPGQWGTHIDPPAHFHAGLRTVDQIRPDEMLLRLVVLDIHARAAADPDSVVTMDDVRAWEKRHGPVPAGAFVALRTDWSKRWPSNAAMQNADSHGVLHYPGWSLPVLKYLYETRHITASGPRNHGHRSRQERHQATTTRSRPTFSAQTITRSRCSPIWTRCPKPARSPSSPFPKPLAGSGFPARVLAVLP